MEALIVTQEQFAALVARDDEDNPSNDLRIVSPTPQGFVMARVLTHGSRRRRRRSGAGFER